MPWNGIQRAAKIFKEEVMNTKKHLRFVKLAVLLTLAATAVPAHAQQAGQNVQADNPEFVRLLDHLGQVGERVVKTTRPEELFALSMEQADTLDRIIAMCRPKEKSDWIRQLAECLLSAAMQSPKNDLRAINRMAFLRADIDRASPGSALAAFVAYQQLQLDHTQLVEVPNVDAASVQQSWRHLLADYINAYPHASETSRALVELATLSEAAGKDEDARRCYRFMLENQPAQADLVKAEGALRRLDLNGQELRLALPLLKEDSLSDEPFDIGSLKGKVVVVYFWTASDEHCLEEMHRIASILGNENGRLPTRMHQLRRQSRPGAEHGSRAQSDRRAASPTQGVGGARFPPFWFVRIASPDRRRQGWARNQQGRRAVGFATACCSTP